MFEKFECKNWKFGWIANLTIATCSSRPMSGFWTVYLGVWDFVGGSHATAGVLEGLVVGVNTS